MLTNLQFSIPEMLSLLGLTQCVYVLVYMLLRSGSIANAIIPTLYFFFMAAAFFLDVAAGHWRGEGIDFEKLRWLLWFSGIPLGTLLIFQIAQIRERLKPKYFSLILFIPLTYSLGQIIDDGAAIYVAGLVMGALSLLTVWLRRDLLDGLYSNARFGHERFWLIMALLVLNVVFLGFTLGFINEVISAHEWLLVRTLLGISFVYIAGTSLFRIYPQVFKKPIAQDANLSPDDYKILEKIQSLIDREKIYQDPTFGRAELARELGTGEANLSRIINQCYGKTIPQFLNEWRVKDAQKLLTDTDVPIQNVFEESGFNSVTTFNRVFKEMSGDTPKEYRAKFRH